MTIDPHRRGHGAAFRIIRTRLGWSMTYAGAMLGVSRVAVGKFERGRPPHARHFLTYSGMAQRAGLPALARLLAVA